MTVKVGLGLSPLSDEVRKQKPNQFLSFIHTCIAPQSQFSDNLQSVSMLNTAFMAPRTFEDALHVIP